MQRGLGDVYCGSAFAAAFSGATSMHILHTSTWHPGQKLILPGGCSIRAAGAGLTVRCQNVDRRGRNGAVRPDLNLCGKYDHYLQNFDVSTGAFFGGPDERVVCLQ